MPIVTGGLFVENRDRNHGFSERRRTERLLRPKRNMAHYRFGTRVHDIGKGTPQAMLAQIGGYGFDCVQLAYKKGIAGVASYEDVTPALVEETVAACRQTRVSIAVHGTYVELSLVEEEARQKQVADFISQIPYTKTLGALCQGSETTNMNKQPAGTTRKEAQEALLRSLAQIMPHAEEAGILVAVEPVFYHAMNTPEAAKMVLDTIASPNLRIIFDAANLISPEDEHRQEAMWDRAMTLWGDKIAAVHIKGVTFDEKGDYHSAFLEDSCIDYPLVARYIRQLPQDLPIMREEEKPDRAVNDLKILKELFPEG